MLMVYVTDAKAGVTFYETLGFTRKELKADFSAVTAGAVELHLHDKNLVSGRYFKKESLAETRDWLWG